MREQVIRSGEPKHWVGECIRRRDRILMRRTRKYASWLAAEAAAMKAHAAGEWVRVRYIGKLEEGEEG